MCRRIFFIDLYPKLCFGHTKVPSNSVMCLVSARATLSSGDGYGPKVPTFADLGVFATR